MKQEFKELLSDFKGLVCWSSLAGEGTGSIFTLGYDLYGGDSSNYVFFFPEFTMSVTTMLEIRKSLR